MGAGKGDGEMGMKEKDYVSWLLAVLKEARSLEEFYTKTEDEAEIFFQEHVDRQGNRTWTFYFGVIRGRVKMQGTIDVEGYTGRDEERAYQALREQLLTGEKHG